MTSARARRRGRASLRPCADQALTAGDNMQTHDHTSTRPPPSSRQEATDWPTASLSRDEHVDLQRPVVEQPRPWYREFYVWMLIALPAAALVAGLATLFLALH